MDTWSSWDTHHWQVTQRGVSQAQGSSLRSYRFEPHILSIPALRSGAKKTRFLAVLKTSGTYRRAVGKWDAPLEECAHIFSCSQAQQRGSRLKTVWSYGLPSRTGPAHPPIPPCTGLPLQPLLVQHCSLSTWKLPSHWGETELVQKWKTNYPRE